MKKYYVILKMVEGVEQPAYIINNVENDLAYHLEYHGDAHTTYMEYKNQEEAEAKMNEYNNLLTGEKL